MAATLDMCPYPWHLREARELHLVLCQMYPSGKAAQFGAQQAGIDRSYINADQPAYMVWKEILDLAAGAQRTRALVERAREQHTANPRRPFLDALLEDRRLVHDSEPRGDLGAPSFVSGTDDVTEPEALLFHDDLTLPIGRVPWLIGVLERLRAVGPAVCRLEVGRNGERQRGTAFRVAPNLLLTNWHVLTFRDAVGTVVTAEFGYEDDGRGGGLASTAVECDVATIKGDRENDWGIVTVSSSLSDAIPILKLSEAAEPVVNGSAFIIQHPGGERKRVAYVRNQVTSFTDRVVHYLSDTQAGSSGSPVLDDAGRLIALHHAGGRPQEVAGKPPLAKNEGISIPAVLRGLTDMGVRVS